MRKNLIKPAINYPYDFLLKRIANSDKIDFTDFLTEKEKQNLISRFDDNIDAEEKISKFVKFNS